MKKAKVTKYDWKLLSSQAVFKNGINVPFSQVTKPNMKKRQPTNTSEVAYDCLLFDCMTKYTK